MSLVLAFIALSIAVFTFDLERHQGRAMAKLVVFFFAVLALAIGLSDFHLSPWKSAPISMEGMLQ